MRSRGTPEVFHQGLERHTRDFARAGLKAFYRGNDTFDETVRDNVADGITNIVTDGDQISGAVSV